MGPTRAGAAVSSALLLVASLGPSLGWAWRNPMMKAAGLWSVALLASAVLVGSDVEEGLRQLGGFWPMLVLPGVMLATRSWGPRPLLWVFLIGSVVTSLHGIAQVRGWFGLRAISRAQSGIDIFSFAMITSAGAICAEYLISSSPRLWAKSMAAACGLLALAGMLCADSRTPFAVFCLVALLLLIFKRRWRLLIGLLALSAALLWFTPSWLGMDRIRHLGQDLSNPSHALAARPLMWQASREMFLNHPLVGVGLGDYKLSFNQMYQDGQFELTHPSDVDHRHAHNILIHTLATQGLVGFTVLLWWLGQLIRAGWRCPAGSRRMFAMALLALELGSGMTDNSVYLTPHLNAFLLLFGVLIAPWPPDQPADRFS